MPGPLDGVLVLDFSTLLPGPMASLILAEAGAEVVKIERPETGEDMRHYSPRWGQDSVNFAVLNRGKKSLALDLRDPGDRKILRPIMERADVLLEQFRPDVMRRLQLDYETVRAVNPGVIYCSITGYGQTGPRRQTAGHDLNYSGDTGLLSLSMGTTETPVIPPALIADIAGGAYPAVMNILLGLRQREQTGEGQHLDIAMADNLFPFVYWALANKQVLGQDPVGGGELVTGGSPRYQLYPTSDGQFVAAAPLEEKFWVAFADTIGLDAEGRDDEKDPAAVINRVARIIRSRPASHWEPLFAAADCCVSIVRTVAEAMEDPQFTDRGLFRTPLVNEAGDVIAALPVPIAREFRPTIDKPLSAPRLGADNDRFRRD